MDSLKFYILGDGDIELNAGRRKVEIEVANTGDRPVQVGSHAHFFEVNRALRFDRAAAFGMRLDIPSTTAVRFEPGDVKPVTLVEIGGAGVVHGMSGLVQGSVRESGALERALGRARAAGFELLPLFPEGEGVDGRGSTRGGILPLSPQGEGAGGRGSTP